MGCDIHCVLEYKHPNGKLPWTGISMFDGIHPSALLYMGINDTPSSNQYSWWRITQRNYALFSDLAGVRGDGPEARGIPEDVSDLARLYIARWEGDGHSHSWGLLSEIGSLFLAHYAPAKILEPERLIHLGRLFNIFDDNTEEDLTHYRLVYFFDN